MLRTAATSSRRPGGAAALVLFGAAEGAGGASTSTEVQDEAARGDTYQREQRDAGEQQRGHPTPRRSHEAA